MNCDQAFDYLTDSARRDSGVLARHLAGCARCRQLKETLEPALDLFDDLVPEPEIGAVGATAPAANEDAVRIAEQSAARLSKPGLSSLSGVRTAVRYAAAVLIGAALVYGFTAPGNPGDDSVCAWKNRTGAQDIDLEARPVVLSCVGCHLSPTKSTDDTSALNLDAFRRSVSLAMLSGDWYAASQFPPGNGLLKTRWQASI